MARFGTATIAAGSGRFDRFLRTRPSLARTLLEVKAAPRAAGRPTCDFAQAASVVAGHRRRDQQQWLAEAGSGSNGILADGDAGTLGTRLELAADTTFRRRRRRAV